MESITGSIIITPKGKEIFISNISPTSPENGDLWLDTSQEPNVLKYYSTTTEKWEIVNDATDEISEIYQTLETNYYTKTELVDEVNTQIGSATITKTNGEVVNMKSALNEVIDTATQHNQTISEHTTELSNLSDNLDNNYTDTSSLESIINQTKDEIMLGVSANYSTKETTITSIITEYYKSTSSSTQVGGSWATTYPTWEDGKYIWQRSIIYYANETSETTTPANITGAKGEQGQDGNTITITSTSITYQNGTSGTVAPTGTWKPEIPTIEKGKFLWVKTTVKYSDNTTTTSYNVSYYALDGINGSDGADGRDGVDGRGISATSVAYKTSTSGTTPPSGTWLTDVPSVPSGQFLWTKTEYTFTDTTKQTVYSVGYKGTDGVSVSSVINYYLATNLSTGVTTSTNGWTTTIQNISTAKPYLWNYEVVKGSDNSTISTTSPVIIGRYGTDGSKGDKGTDGISITGIKEYYAVSTSNSVAPSTWYETLQTMSPTNRYLWNYEVISYSDNTNDTTLKRVIGVYGDKGEQGIQGIQGIKGADGQSQWTHIRYSANSNGNPLQTSPQTTTKYIGIAVTTSSTAPTSYTSYTWSKFIGEDGADGVDGVKGDKGADGTTYYTWIKYADTPTTGMSDYPANKTYIGIAHNKTTATESSVYSDYAWSLIKGDKGDKGDTGIKGDTGAIGTSVTSVAQQYYLSSSSTTQTGGSWVNSIPAITTSGKYLWVRNAVTLVTASGSTSTTYTTPILDSNSTYAYGRITTNADNINLKVAKVDYTGETVVSMINQTADTVKIQAKNIDLEGAVTFSDLSSSAKSDIINSIDVGGRNLLLRSDLTDQYTGNSFTVDGVTYNTYARGYAEYNVGLANPTTSYHSYIDNETFGFPVVVYNESNGIRNWKGSRRTVLGQVDKSGTYTISFDVYATGLGTRLFGGFYYTKIGETTANFHSGQYNINVVKSNEWHRVSGVCKLNNDVDFTKSVVFYLYGCGFSTDSILYVRRHKLEYGNKATDWTPAPEDVDSILSNWAQDENKTYIDGGKVYANSITGNQIQTNAITADKIKANEITADHFSTSAKDTLAMYNTTTDSNITDTIDSPIFVTNWVKNLFDGQIEVGNINIDTGNNLTSTTRTRSKNFVKVEPNTKYRITRSSGGIRRVLGYDTSKKLVTDSNHALYKGAVLELPNGVLSGTFTTTATTEYLRWYDSNNTDTTEKVIITEGEQVHPYAPHTGYDITACGKNLFDESKRKDNTSLLWENGGEYSNVGAVTTDFIPVLLGKTYKSNYYGQYITYNANKVMISNNTMIRHNNITIADNNVKFLRIAFRPMDNNNIDMTLVTDIQVEVGSTSTPYEPYQSSTITVSNDLDIPSVGLKSYEGVTNILNDYGVPIEVQYPLNSNGKRLFEDAYRRGATIDQWTYTGKTTIDGGNIETDTIKAVSIDVDDVFAEDITFSGSITGGNEAGGGIIKSSNYVPNTTGTYFNLADGSIDTKGFKVDSAGNVVATAGTVGGWTINTNKISKTSGTVTTTLGQDSLIEIHDSQNVSNPYIGDFPAFNVSGYVDSKLLRTIVSGGMVFGDYGQSRDLEEWEVFRNSWLLGFRDRSEPGLYFIDSNMNLKLHMDGFSGRIRGVKELYGEMIESDEVWCDTLSAGQTFASGLTSITPTAANVVTSKAVAYNRTMSPNPKVVLTPGTSVPQNVTMGYGGRATTGFTAYLRRTDTTETFFCWFATNHS